MNELQMMDNNPNQKQRKVDNQRIKQEYKSKAETALDNVVRLWNNAKINGSSLELGEEHKSPIIRYYKNYWLSDMVTGMLAISFIIFVLSFYRMGEATLLFIVLFGVMYGYSEKMFLKFYLKDFSISKTEENIILNKIFPNRSSWINNSLMLALILGLSLGSAIFSFNFDYELPVNITKYLSFGDMQFQEKNIIFAFLNLILALLLTADKFVKKYRR